MITRYEKELQRELNDRYPDLTTNQLLELLLELGVVDFSRCKVLSIREWVYEQVRKGMKKVDAMWEASDYFSCSYEYVRKCIYYYTDINLH